MTTQDWNGAVVPEQMQHEVNRLQRTSSLVDLAARDGVPFPQRPAINNALPYMNMVNAKNIRVKLLFIPVDPCLFRAQCQPVLGEFTGISFHWLRAFQGAIGPYRPSMPVYTYYSYKNYFPYRNYRGYTLVNILRYFFNCFPVKG